MRSPGLASGAFALRQPVSANSAASDVMNATLSSPHRRLYISCMIRSVRTVLCALSLTLLAGSAFPQAPQSVPPPRAPQSRAEVSLSFAPVVKRAAPAVVNVYASRVETATRLITNATSLGGTHSLMESRYRWEGDRIPRGLLRLSVGLEDADALWEDLAQALETT